MSSYRWLCVGVAVLLSSCVIEVNTDPRLAPATDEELWSEQFNAYADDFNAGKESFAEEAYAISGAGSRFFWMDGDLRLHSHDVSSMKRFDYDLPLSLEVYPPFMVGADAIITAQFSGFAWELSAYAIDEPSVLMSSTSLSAGGGASLRGYTPPIAVDGSDVYLLDQENALFRWRPSTGALELLFALADRGLGPGAVPWFSVHGDDVLLLHNQALEGADYQGGALWRVQISGGEAELVEEAATGACLQEGEALYGRWEDDGTVTVIRYFLSDRHTEDLSALVRETDLDLGPFGANKKRYASLYNVECQPGGVTWNNGLGWFFLESKEHEAQTLYLNRIYLSYEEQDSFEEYWATAIVGPVAFLWVNKCAFSEDMFKCMPAVYTRDLSAH